VAQAMKRAVDGYFAATRAVVADNEDGRQG